MAPPPFVTCFCTVAKSGFRSSRFGPTFPLVPAAPSVWQLPQFCVKTDLPAALVVAPPPAEPLVVVVAGGAALVVVVVACPLAPSRYAISCGFCPLPCG